MKNVLLFTLALGMSVSMIGCNMQSNSESNATRASNLAVTLQKTYGTTDDFTIVKFGQDNANYAVIRVSGFDNYTMAVDISTYTAGRSWSSYLQTASVFTRLTDNGNGTYSCYSSTCYQEGNGSSYTNMTFEKTTGETKDLEKAAALVEAFQVETMASTIASQFGLSDDRSVKVAQLAASWNKLSKTRALTDADADAFSKELTGVSMTEMNSAQKASADGSNGALNDILTKAAEVNGTTSENMSAIMLKLFL